MRYFSFFIVICVLLSGCGFASRLSNTHERGREEYIEIKIQVKEALNMIERAENDVEFFIRHYPKLYEDYLDNKDNFPESYRKIIEAFHDRWAKEGGLKDELLDLKKQNDKLRERLSNIDDTAQEYDDAMKEGIEIVRKIEDVTSKIAGVLFAFYR